MAAALLGSCFPTTIYIGHPGWKRMGARSGYSVLNAGFFTVIGLSGASALLGYLVPIEAGMARVYDCNLKAETYMYIGGDERNRFEGRPPVPAPAAPRWMAARFRRGWRASRDHRRSP